MRQPYNSSNCSPSPSSAEKYWRKSVSAAAGNQGVLPGTVEFIRYEPPSQALIALLTGQYSLAKRAVARELLGIAPDATEYAAIAATDRAGALSFPALGTTLAPVRAMVAGLLREGHHADAQTKTVCHNLRALEPALWTCLRVEGVEPTNNAAERSQRRGVMKRDRTFGTQTSAGSRYVERILTTVATCQQQGRDPLTSLRTVLRAAARGTPLPSLLPG